MKRIFKAYSQIFRILAANGPFLIVAAFISAIIAGVASPLLLVINSQVFNMGLQVAAGEMGFSAYLPYLVLYVILALLPVLVGDVFVSSFIKPRCRLVLRTAYKGMLLKKLKRLRYEHLESKNSAEVIDKAYHRVEETVLSLFPDAAQQTITAGIAAVGTLWLLGTVRWWLLLIVLIPFAFETWFAQRFYKSVSDEMETYWKQEHSYNLLSRMLRSREHVTENHLLGSGEFLIHTYEQRLNKRNREYERFFLKHLRRSFLQQNLTRFAQIGTAILLLFFYLKGEVSIGLLISLTLALFGNLFSGQGLTGLVKTIRASEQYIRNFDFYDNYFALSEEEYGPEDRFPQQFDIRFENVTFTYPGSKTPVLRGVSFLIRPGERVSLVGANGEGKSTLIKLLLGLFQPDSGQILIGGKPLSQYSHRVRSHLFGTVFQDFVKYSIPLRENVGIGDIERLQDPDAVDAAMVKAKVDAFSKTLEKGKDALLGRDFEGGVELSGGQWQRIAIARAFMGDKPILILDEPTSQLDPIAESRIFSEFAQLSAGKTSLFISHRLGSATIADRVLVLSEGKIAEEGSHEQLLHNGGLYAHMFEAQKQWYMKKEEEPFVDI
jgi:ATP-binding cassette subfamily B protein